MVVTFIHGGLVVLFGVVAVVHIHIFCHKHQSRPSKLNIFFPDPETGKLVGGTWILLNTIYLPVKANEAVR